MNLLRCFRIKYIALKCKTFSTQRKWYKTKWNRILLRIELNCHGYVVVFFLINFNRYDVINFDYVFCGISVSVDLLRRLNCFVLIGIAIWMWIGWFCLFARSFCRNAGHHCGWQFGAFYKTNTPIERCLMRFTPAGRHFHLIAHSIDECKNTHFLRR